MLCASFSHGEWRKANEFEVWNNFDDIDTWWLLNDNKTWETSRRNPMNHEYGIDIWHPSEGAEGSLRVRQSRKRVWCRDVTYNIKVIIRRGCESVKRHWWKMLLWKRKASFENKTLLLERKAFLMSVCYKIILESEKRSDVIYNATSCSKSCAQEDQKKIRQT